MSDSAIHAGEMPISEFVPNEPDNAHCFQAAYRMALAAHSAIHLAKQAAEHETGWIAGKPTWPYTGILHLAQRGFRLTSIEFLDIPKFIHDPLLALKEMIDDQQVLREVVDTTNLHREAAAARECLEHKGVTMLAKVPTVTDIRDAVDADGLVICNVNARILDDSEGYAPHFVLITGATKGEFVLQNPGLPPHANQRVSSKRFESAWYFPDERLGNMIAVFSD
jgi:hypothetical protein